MLKMSFRKDWRPDSRYFIQDSDAMFRAEFDIENLVHPMCKEIVKYIDNSEVLYPGVIKSPVLGYIPPEKLSGGCKHVLLAWQGDYLLYSPRMGDNCIEPLLWVVKDKDVYLRCTTLFLAEPEQYATKLFFSVEENRVIEDMADYTQLQYKYDDTGFYNGQWQKGDWA